MDFYARFKFTHVAAVLLSGLLFLLRGLMVQSGRQEMALRAPLRYLSYTIDTVLLVSALALLTILPGAAYANGWLAAKLALLVVYIVCGALALKRAPTQRARLAFFMAALLTYGFMLSIARAHDPLGLLRVWLGSG
jgi:uncharacterized membrane protein SirB2